MGFRASRLGAAQQMRGGMVDRTLRAPATARIAAIPWVVLFAIQLVMLPMRGDPRASFIFAIASCMEIALWALAALVWAVLTRSAARSAWQVRDLLWYWAWTAALVLTGIHLDSPQRLLLEFELYSLEPSVSWLIAGIRLVVSPLIVLWASIRSLVGSKGYRRLYLVVLICAPALLWFIWASSGHSP